MSKTWTERKQKAVRRERLYWLKRIYLSQPWSCTYVIIKSINVKRIDGHIAAVITFKEGEVKYKAVYLGGKDLDELSSFLGKEIQVLLNSDRSGIIEATKEIDPWKV